MPYPENKQLEEHPEGSMLSVLIYYSQRFQMILQTNVCTVTGFDHSRRQS